jgi:hypothetical protein
MARVIGSETPKPWDVWLARDWKPCLAERVLRTKSAEVQRMYHVSPKNEKGPTDD